MVSDPIALWDSINWISVAAVRSFCRNYLRVRPYFDVRILNTYIDRAMNDVEFQARHSPLICSVLRRLDAWGFFAGLPPRAGPVHAGHGLPHHPSGNWLIEITSPCRPRFCSAHTTATFTQWIGGNESKRQLHSSPPSRPIQSWPVVVPK